MALEKEVVVDKFKEEGINENLSNGLSFETEDELSSWVDTYKSGLPEPAKKLEEYTKEELEEIAKDPQFKGAKGLQGFLDSQRQKFKSKVIDPIEPKPVPKVELDDETKKRLEEFDVLKNEIAQDKFERKVKKMAKDFDDDDIDLIINKLKIESTEDEIKEAIENHKSYLSKKGIKQFGTPGGGGNSKRNAQAFKKWAEEEKARKKKFNVK